MLAHSSTMWVTTTAAVLLAYRLYGAPGSAFHWRSAAVAILAGAATACVETGAVVGWESAENAVVPIAAMVTCYALAKVRRQGRSHVRLHLPRVDARSLHHDAHPPPAHAGDGHVDDAER